MMTSVLRVMVAVLVSGACVVAAVGPARAEGGGPPDKPSPWRVMSIPGAGTSSVTSPPGPDSGAHARVRGGIPRQQAGQELDDQIAFENAATVIMQADRDNVAMFGFDEDRTAWLIMKRPPTPEVVAALGQLPRATQVRYGAPVSANELDALQERIQDSLYRTGVVKASLAVTDARDLSIDVTYSLLDERKPLSSSDVRTLLRAVAAPLGGHFPVDVRVAPSPGPVASEHAVHR